MACRVFCLKITRPACARILRKHASRPELAYILVENRAGEIFAHSFAVLPQEIQGSSSFGDRPADSRRLLQMGENVAEEVSAPILEGRGGAVRVGIWRAHVDAEVHETVIPLIKLLGFALSGGIFIAAFLAWRINHPIFRLVAAAKAISSGDLDRPAPRVEDVSEFGELVARHRAHALECQGGDDPIKSVASQLDSIAARTTLSYLLP
jgi:methyl-accepting chemotaxis protein